MVIRDQQMEFPAYLMERDLQGLEPKVYRVASVQAGQEEEEA